MSRIVANILKDLGRMRRDPAAFLVSLALPLIIGSLLSLISGPGSTPTAKLLVADLDNSMISGFVVGAFQQDQLADVVTTQTVTEAEGRALMDDGKASGLLIIPEGFGSKALDRTPATLTLITNPAQRILPGILESSLELMIDAGSGLQQVLSTPIERLTYALPEGSNFLPDTLVADVSVTFNQLFKRAEPFLLPPVIGIETVIEEDEESSTNIDFGLLFFPGMFLMALLFVGQNMSDDLWKERVAGTLRRVVTTPQSTTEFMLGKLAAQGLGLLAISIVAMLAGRFLFGLDLQNVPLAILWASLGGLQMLILFTLLQMLSGTQRGGNLLTTIILFPLIMMGGSFFPFEAMPTWLAAVGKFTPNGWTLVQLKAILAGNPDPTVLGITAASLLGVSMLLFALILMRLRGFARTA